MSLSRYELQMLEEKRKQEELKKEQKKVSLIISIVVIASICCLAVWFVNEKLTVAINEVDSMTTKETPKSKE